MLALLTFSSPVEWIIAASAAVSAVGLLTSKTVNAARRVVAIHTLIEHELKPNSGGSIKDQLTRIDLQLNPLADRVQDMARRMSEVERLVHVDHERIWQLTRELNLIKIRLNLESIKEDEFNVDN